MSDSFRPPDAKSNKPVAPSGSPFSFGKNWTSYLTTINNSRIDSAVRSLRSILASESVGGKSFLDVGCGSGLTSLAAALEGAAVTSIDLDDDCITCTNLLRERFFSTEAQDHLSMNRQVAAPRQWTVIKASILDEKAINDLGYFDVVYSWGVLHHTGQMNRAIQMASDRVKPGGLFAIAIYNNQGGASRRWSLVKRLYQKMPSFFQPLYVVFFAAFFEFKFAILRLLRGKNPLPFAAWRSKSSDRGMSVWHDWVDWIGGWPFEVASPEEIVNPLVNSGFSLIKLKTVGHGWGCNEYLFKNQAERPVPS